MHLHFISRDVAKKRGLKRFFTGEHCKRGEIAERLTSTSACLCFKCKDEYKKNKIRAEESDPSRRVARLERLRNAWKKNREVHSEKRREKYREDPEKIKQAVREYAAKNKEAKREYNQEYRLRNISRIAQQRRAKYQETRDRVLDERKAYYRENKAEIRERHKRYRKNNPEVFKALQAKHRADRRLRVPIWFGELDALVMEEAFDLAMMRYESTSVRWHVDHMIPMKAEKCSGLHCWNNVQVIPAKLNLEKHHKMVLTDPLEWLNHI